MMADRVKIALVLSIWLVVLAFSKLARAQRWSRQVSNSEWIPLANPQGQNPQGQNQNLVPQVLPQIHQPLIPSSLPPELRQEYQQQLLQLQKTQESIQRLLALQQQLKAQQQLLQGQGFLPNGLPESDENKQALHQSALSAQGLPELAPDDVIPHQLSGHPKLPVYTSQNFHEQQGEAVGQEQYEDYNDRQIANYRNPERAREELREKGRYRPETSSGPGSEGENNNDGEEEVQVVYVPAETLAQRGQAKNQQRDRDRKQFGHQDTRHHQPRPYSHQQGSFEGGSHQRDNNPTTVSPEEDAYARDFLQQLQREHEGTDRLLKEAREKELARLREERKEIQRRAKLQQAALQREQELQRQREAEKKQKELDKLEEDAKQRELERIRESRERQRLEELERSKKAQARINEEKRKQEEARQAEIDRLAALERQKKAEIERTIAAQKDLERLQKEEEERAREAERSHLARQKEASKIRHDDAGVSPQAQPLTRQHNNQQHLGQSGKYHRHGRIRNKQRQRQHNQNIDNSEQTVQETTTTTPPSPNQPPLAVYMSKLVGDGRNIRITDVLKTLKGAQTIDVLDNVGQNAPDVFVGPSNLEAPGNYAKFDLPYLSSIDNNRVERRVDKLPFFVAPLSFNPPPGYSKIPFPAPHIGSVVINNLDSNIPIIQPDESLDEVRQSNLNPLIEPNAFSDESNKGLSYSNSYDSSTTPTHTTVRHEEPSSTSQYQPSSSYSNVETSGPHSSYRFRQSFNVESPSSLGSQGQSKLTYHEQSQLRPNFQEESSLPLDHDIASQYHEDSTRPTTPVYRRPNVVTAFAYQESSQLVPSSTPIYDQSYSNIRDDTPHAPANAQLVSGNFDPTQHREVGNRYQFTDQGKNERGQDYPREHVNPDAVRYEDSPTGPTQYNLPAELPPIHPQLPGLVNSLLEDGEQARFVERHPNLPTTTVTSTTKIATTTETPLTTQRSRGRQRGRVVPTRPTTTTTTSLSPPGKSRETDRTRRPFARTRSRFTTTTEEYMEPYEPTKNKAAATTPRYNTQDNSRRPISSKLTKSKNRETDGNIHSSRHQSHNVQAHEAANRNPSLDTNSRQPEAGEVDSNQQMYAQYDFASATTSRENYPIPDNHGAQVHSTTGEMEFTKTLTSPQTKAAAVTSLQNQGDPIAHHFQEHYPNSDSSQPGLEDTPVNGFNYQIRNEQATTPTIVPPTSRDYPYYQDKQESFDSSQIPVVPTNAPFKSQINHYQRPPHYENPGLVRPQSQFPISDDQTSDFDVNHDSLYDPYSRDNEDALRSTGLLPEQAPLELTTEVPTTTTTTTEAAPVTFRQRVRARLGGRPRSDSLIQTKPRGSNDEYVRFSAVNNQNIQTTERPTTRHRESHRSKPKARQQHHGSQVQTEGNEYVRIQAPVRSFQKTIVTPPSTTQRTTTTQAPTTTTVEYESPNDELEYGFIRPPSFVPIHPVDNRYQNSYRLADNQAQVQSILPTDETASDTIPNHDQVPRNRPKYQSPNRRPANKVVSSTTLTSDTSPYTERSRTRVEEPKNNRIRPRGRKPGRRRTTTTTTTTTEYVLEENNDLPLEENYPRPAQHLDDLAQDRPEFFDEKFEAQPLTSEGLTNPGQQQERENSFSNQAFLLDFGSESDQLSNPELDQTQLASQPSRKYGRPGATGSGSHLRANQERDIYGSESQWSTKLTSTSFQPSASVNRLVDDDPKKASFTRSGKNKYSNDEARNEAPEVITAPPEEPYVTIMVSSDDLSEKPAIPSADSSLEILPMTDINYGMKMGVDNRKTPIEKTTPAPVGRKTLVANATNMAVNNEGEKSGDSEWPNQPPRRVSGRRRRVRVRVRPAVSDDFVTAESQHFNSAINNLLRDRVKYGGRHEESKETTTVAASSFDRYVNTETPEESIFEDLLKEVFKEDDKSSTISDVATSEKTEKVPTVSNQSEVSTDQPNAVTDEPQEVSNQPEVTSHPPEVSTQPEVASEEPSMLTEEPEIVTGQSEIMTNQSEAVTTAANQFDVVNTSENSTNVVAEQTPHPDDEYSSTVDYSNASESSTSTPLMGITMNPRKSPDSTGSFNAASGLSSENGIFDDNGITGQHNEVLENDYTEAATKNDINSLTQNIGELNYPKNHRSEWSEVRYPTNPEFYNYHRQFNVTTTQLPGTETKSDGDASVKTLSDYVKAIFDTMKDADEQKIEKDTFPTADSMSSDDQLVSTSSNDSSGTIENFETDPTTVPSSFRYSTESAVKSEDSSVKTPSNFSQMEAGEKHQQESQKPVNTEDSNGDEEVTEELKNTDIGATTKYVDVTTEMSTDGNFVDSSSASGNLESSETSTIVESGDPNESKIDQITTSTTESPPTTEGSHQMNLGAILRTSTTTKVSHMTEICYRGRCVMTKPKNEIYAR